MIKVVVDKIHKQNCTSLMKNVSLFDYCRAKRYRVSMFTVTFIIHHSYYVLTIIKTIKKFTNVIAYHQPDLSTNRTVRASCL